MLHYLAMFKGFLPYLAMWPLPWQLKHTSPELSLPFFWPVQSLAMWPGYKFSQWCTFPYLHYVVQHVPPVHSFWSSLCALESKTVQNMGSYCKDGQISQFQFPIFSTIWVFPTFVLAVVACQHCRRLVHIYAHCNALSLLWRNHR